VSRVLNGLRIRTTLIDHDPNQVELVRRFGNPAYYGDASRLDVLERAGLARARLLVVAIDDDGAALRMVKQVRRRYPDLAIIARAHSRTDAYELLELRVPAVRETFGSALEAAELALRSLGFGPLAARRVATQFRRHDEELMEQMAAHRGEVQQLIALNQQGRLDLEKLLTAEIHQRDAGRDESRGEGEARA
jgi:voltage-gated potassium channel Kch